MDRRQFIAAAAATTLAATVRGQSGPMRVGVIGHTGQGNYGHGVDVMWLKIPETTVVAVADADEAGLKGAMKKLKVEKGFVDYRAMLAEMKPDIVAVAPRHVDEHYAMIMAAIGGGARGIYVEKPICKTLEQADEIAAACAKRNVKLAIAHRNRYNPAINTVAKFVADGGIGRFLEVRGRGKEDLRGGAEDLWVLGTHVMNLAFFFAGPPVACSATLLQDGKPVTKSDVHDGNEGLDVIAGNEVHARFETQSGVPAFFESVKGAGEKTAGFGLQLIGTKGVIDLRMDETPIAHLLAGSPFAPTAGPRAWVPISTAGPGSPEPIANLINLVKEHTVSGRDLVAAVRDNRAPLCSADDGRLLVEMIMAIFESHRMGGARVMFPLKSRQNPLRSL